MVAPSKPISSLVSAALLRTFAFMLSIIARTLGFNACDAEIDMACTISVNALAARQSGIDVEWTVPVEGCKVDTDGLWIPRGLPENEEYWAKQFINFALTRDAQQAWCGALGLPPVFPGIEPPEGMAGDPAYPTTEEDFARLVRIPSPVLVENQPIWFEHFQEIFQG